jgi:hypothetical protein
MEYLICYSPEQHNTRREGFHLGLVVATSIWIWLAAVDAIAGEPFHTFHVLGGMAAFTVVHYVLNIAYGMAIVAWVHGAMRQPSLIGGLAMSWVIIEFAFIMATVVLANVGLGALAWLRIFGGSIIAAAVALALLLRRHPLGAVLRQSGVEEVTP